MACEETPHGALVRFSSESESSHIATSLISRKVSEGVGELSGNELSEISKFSVDGKISQCDMWTDVWARLVFFS